MDSKLSNPKGGMHRKSDLRFSILFGVASWLLSIAIDFLGQRLFKLHSPPEVSSLPIFVAYGFLSSGLFYWKEIGKDVRSQVISRLLLTLITMVVVTIPRTYSMAGLFVCVPMIALLAYMLFPVYRAVQVVDNRLRAEARKSRENGQD